MTVAELISRLQQPDVKPDWDVYINPFGENLDVEVVQADSEMEAVVLVPDT